MEREGHEYIPMWQLKKSGSVVTWSNTLSYYYLFIGTNRYTIKCIASLWLAIGKVIY